MANVKISELPGVSESSIDPDSAVFPMNNVGVTHKAGLQAAVNAALENVAPRNQLATITGDVELVPGDDSAGALDCAGSVVSGGNVVGEFGYFTQIVESEIVSGINEIQAPFATDRGVMFLDDVSIVNDGSVKINASNFALSSTKSFYNYNTEDETTNFEATVVDWAANVSRIYTRKSGSGSTRGIRIGVATSNDSGPSHYLAIGPSSNARFIFVNSNSTVASIDGTGKANFGSSDQAVSVLESGGSFGANVVTITANASLDVSDYKVLVDATSGNVTVTLPAVSSCARRIYDIQRIDNSGNTVTIDGDGAETINGLTTQPITAQYSGWIIQTSGATGWFGHNYGV